MNKLLISSNNKNWNEFLRVNNFRYVDPLEKYFNTNYSAMISRDWPEINKGSIWTIIFDKIEDKFRFQLEWL